MTKDYSKLEKDDLLKVIEKLESRKKYGLIWDEEKTKEQFEKESENALPVLKEIKGKEIKTDPAKPTNIIIEGDNYHALSVLNYTHQGKVDVIYIDPPYNTGNKSWKYNNSYVELDDAFKHSKWLSFMYKRLRLAKSVLAEDGIICVTIDDYEFPRLLLIMEELFGEENHLGTAAIRINPGGRKTKRSLAAQHEYAIFFAKNPDTLVAKIIKPISEKTHSYKQDIDGSWYEERGLRKEGQDSLATENSSRYYPIYYDPKTGIISSKKKLQVEILPIDTDGQKRIWRRDKDHIDELYQKHELIYKKTKYGNQIYFKFRGGTEGETPKSFWDDVKYSASEHGTQVLDKILGKTGMFPFPKSWYAVSDCIKVCSAKTNAIVLDFFAGSGTTAQSVLELNKQDKGNRQFILCTNNEGNIAEDICYPRVKKIIKGYSSIIGLGGNLKYYKTAFIKKSISRDDLKIRITRECTEMLCLREGIFEEKKAKDDYHIFEQNGKVMAIYYALERDGLEQLKKEMDKIKGEKILYCFTLDPLGLNKNDFVDWQDINLEPIPQKILDIYEQIYEY